MNTKLILLLIGLVSFTAASANIEPEPSCKPATIVKKKTEVAGSVVNSDTKSPLKDVNVTAYLVSKKEKAVKTDDGGVYAFDELKPGTYRFVFEKAGFKRVTREKVVVKSDEEFQLNIEMAEAKGVDFSPSPLHFSDF